MQPTTGTVQMFRYAMTLLIRFVALALIAYGAWKMVIMLVQFIRILPGMRNHPSPLTGSIIETLYHYIWPGLTLLIPGILLAVFGRRIASWLAPIPEYRCIQCGYRLEHLTSARCPECGMLIGGVGTMETLSDDESVDKNTE